MQRFLLNLFKLLSISAGFSGVLKQLYVGTLTLFHFMLLSSTCCLLRFVVLFVLCTPGRGQKDIQFNEMKWTGLLASGVHCDPAQVEVILLMMAVVQSHLPALRRWSLWNKMQLLLNVWVAPVVSTSAGKCGQLKAENWTTGHNSRGHQCQPNHLYMLQSLCSNCGQWARLTPDNPRKPVADTNCSGFSLWEQHAHTPYTYTHAVTQQQFLFNGLVHFTVFIRPYFSTLKSSLLLFYQSTNTSNHSSHFMAPGSPCLSEAPLPPLSASLSSCPGVCLRLFLSLWVCRVHLSLWATKQLGNPFRHGCLSVVKTFSETFFSFFLLVWR